MLVLGLKVWPLQQIYGENVNVTNNTQIHYLSKLKQTINQVRLDLVTHTSNPAPERQMLPQSSPGQTIWDPGFRGFKAFTKRVQLAAAWRELKWLVFEVGP